MIEILLLILGLVVLIIFAPFFNFICGWLTGWFIKITFGATFVTGLQMLGINIAPETIPLLCGTLSIIGGFFKSTEINKNNQDKIKNIFNK